MSANGVLKVHLPGLATLIVDKGRPHSRHLGLPTGGAADQHSYLLGNALVGNDGDAAALEIGLAGPTLSTTCPLACVILGAPIDACLDDRLLTHGHTFTFLPDQTLRFGGTSRGARAYLCVTGGLQTPVILGSRSSLRFVRSGDELPCYSSSIRSRYLPTEAEEALPGTLVELRVLPGAQADWFHEEEFYDNKEYRVRPESNRMGLRLKGQPLSNTGREMASEPVCPGTVQVTRDGQCIVLGVDGQTIGGYPKIAQVIAADLDRLGQLRPTDTLCFRRVTLKDAETAWKNRQVWTRTWLERIRTSFVW